MKIFKFLILMQLLSSCSSYKKSFDCPPPQGIGCYSVSEIESMVVEKEKGEDLFIAKSPKNNSSCKKCENPPLKRAWVSGSHYIYFSLKE